MTHLTMKLENKKRMLELLSQYINRTIRDYYNDLRECSEGRGHIEAQIDKYNYVAEQLSYFNEHYNDEFFDSYFHLDSIKNGLDHWFSRICNSLYGFPLVKTVAEKENICENIIDDFCEYTVKPVFGEKVASELKSKMQVIKCEEPYIEIDTDNMEESVWDELAEYYRPYQLNLKTHLEELLLDMHSEYLY